MNRSKWPCAGLRVDFQYLAFPLVRRSAIIVLSIALLSTGCTGGLRSTGNNVNSSAPTPTTYLLTVNSTAPASGATISVAPADHNGRTSGTTGFTLTYNAGTAVTLTAPATSGSNTFSSWTGCATANAVTCTVTLNANTAVTANYTAPVTYALTVNSTAPASGVSVSASPADNNGATTGTTSFTFIYNAGTTVTLTTPATSGSNTFSSWTGCATANAVTCTVTLNANTAVTANYTAPVTYALTVNSVNPASGVSVSASPADNNGATTGTTSFTFIYNAGTTVTLTTPATSGIGTFSAWTGCATANSVTCAVVMNANTAVTANYAVPVTHALMVNSINPASGVAINVAPADNVWFREGVVLAQPPGTSDVALEPTLVPPEGNPQILTSYSTVWKMWFSDGAQRSIDYAESPDGIAWTRYGTTASNPYGTPVVSGCLRSFVVENSGTYYLYCAPLPPGDQTIDEYTSTDGVHFTLAHASVIQDGMGSWNTGLNDNSGGVVVNGTLYLFVENSYIGIGLFTSTDFYSFTPVSLVIPGPAQGPTVPYLVNGSWYLWAGYTFNQSVPGSEDFGIQRWSAPALTGPWTNSESGFDFLPQAVDEGVGTPYAQTLDPFVIEVGGKTYLYYTANQGTSENPQQYEIIKLAIADMPLSDLVQTAGGMSADGATTGTTGFTLIYNAGTTVTLTAPATSGSGTFASWTGCTTANAVTCTVVMNANKTATANYTISPQYHAYGDSITYGYSLSDPAAQAYPALVAASEELPFLNYAISGDQACDVPTRQIFPNEDNPTLAAHMEYSVLIGTNDVDLKGTGAYESVFMACHQATLSWLAIPAEYKVLANDSSVTTSGPGAIDRSNHWNAWTTAGQGSSVSFPITMVRNGPIYAWPRINDDTPATYTYSLDGVVLGTASTQTNPIISTQNGTTNSLGFLRLPAVSAGSHVVTFTQTSAGTNGVSVVGIGTPVGPTGNTLPTVLAGTIPYQFNNGQCNTSSDEPCLEYIQDIEADVNLFSADGLDVRLFDTRKYMLGTAADMNDTVHPNVLGQIELSQSVEASW